MKHRFLISPKEEKEQLSFDFGKEHRRWERYCDDCLKCRSMLYQTGFDELAEIMASIYRLVMEKKLMREPLPLSEPKKAYVEYDRKLAISSASTLIMGLPGEDDFNWLSSEGTMLVAKARWEDPQLW